MCWKFRFRIMRVRCRPDKIIYIYIFSSMSKNRHSRPVLDSFTGCSGPGNDRTTKIQRLKLRRTNRWLLIIYCLVVEPYPSEKWWSSSVGMMTFNIWKNKKCSKAPTSLCTILRAHKNDTISVEPSILFVFLLLTPPKSRKKTTADTAWVDISRAPMVFDLYSLFSKREHF